MSISMNNINRGYLAGVIDSDGSITISKRRKNLKTPNYICMIQLTWTETKLTTRFFKELIKSFGGSYFKINANRSDRFENGKPVIKYCAVGKAASAILNYIHPYLVLKREQAINGLRLAEYKSRGKSTDLTLALSELLYIKNKKLNSKNKRAHADHS